MSARQLIFVNHLTPLVRRQLMSVFIRSFELNCWRFPEKKMIVVCWWYIQLSWRLVYLAAISCCYEFSRNSTIFLNFQLLISQICIYILSRCRTSYTRRICSHG